MIEVRLASWDEAPLVLEITGRAFEEWRGALDPPSGAIDETIEAVLASMDEGGAVLAFVDGRPAGSARYALRGDHVYCGRLAVLPLMRRMGVAGAILDFIEGIARHSGVAEVRLSTREVMESNLRMYERYGYALVGRAPHPRGPGIIVDFAKIV